MGCLLVYPLGFSPVLVAVFLSVIREKASRHKGKSEPKVGIKIEMWEPFPYFHRECREIIHQHGVFLSVYCKKSVAGIPPELPCFGTGNPCLFRPLRQDAGWPCGIAPDGLRSVLPGLSEKEIPEHKKNPGQKVWKFCPGEEMVSRCIRIPRFRRCRISSRCQRRKWSRWRV